MQPPFNNLKLREAVLNLVDQKDYHGRRGRRPEILEDLRRAVRLRHAVETNAGADALLTGPTSTRPSS